MNTTTEHPDRRLVRDVTPGQIVKVGPYTGTVISVGKAPRSPKWTLLADVGGQKTDLRTEPDSPVTVLSAQDAPSVRAEDHQPNFDNPGGTSCSCGWAPKNRPTRNSMWSAPYNRHVRGLGLLGV